MDDRHIIAGILIAVLTIIGALVTWAWLDGEGEFYRELAEVCQAEGMEARDFQSIYNLLRDIPRRGRTPARMMHDEIDVAAWRARRAKA
jgi:hypothetical protein